MTLKNTNMDFTRFVKFTRDLFLFIINRLGSSFAFSLLFRLYEGL